jgi:hypothetical protein
MGEHGGQAKKKDGAAMGVFDFKNTTKLQIQAL